MYTEQGSSARGQAVDGVEGPIKRLVEVIWEGGWYNQTTLLLFVKHLLLIFLCLSCMVSKTENGFIQICHICFTTAQEGIILAHSFWVFDI